MKVSPASAFFIEGIRYSQSSTSTTGIAGNWNQRKCTETISILSEWSNANGQTRGST